VVAEKTALIAVHARLDSSRANGPGRRAVIWFQGCSLGCPGCYNPSTHEAAPPTQTRQTTDELLAWLKSLSSIEGVSLSGGEPFEQLGGLDELTATIRAELPELSILIFSGFSIAELRAKPAASAVLDRIDVLIDGRYVNKLHRGSSLRGSENQHIHCLTDRYSIEDVEATPATEVSIGPDGSVVLTGVSPLDVLE